MKVPDAPEIDACIADRFDPGGRSVTPRLPGVLDYVQVSISPMCVFRDLFKAKGLDTGEATRTPDPRIMRPQTSGSNDLKAKELRQEAYAVGRDCPKRG
jgi:hypothetical protein